MRPTFTKRYPPTSDPAVGFIKLLDFADSGTANICKLMQEQQGSIIRALGGPAEMMQEQPHSTIRELRIMWRMAAQANRQTMTTQET